MNQTMTDTVSIAPITGPEVVWVLESFYGYLKD